MRDGGLRQLFQKHLPEAHWQSVETWSTGQGVPDVEYCFPGGHQGWVEFKLAIGLKVRLEPEQVAWLERRSRAGGASFVAVRLHRKKSASRFKIKPVDALFLYRGDQARGVMLNGLEALPLAFWQGGPSGWDWGEIRNILCKKEGRPKAPFRP